VIRREQPGGLAVGARPYADGITACDSFLTGLPSFGEGDHNFHHRFWATIVTAFGGSISIPPGG
jgi:fatty-acid desaturase